MTDLQKLENFLQMHLPLALGRVVRYYKDKDTLTDEDILNYFAVDHNLRLTRVGFKYAMRASKIEVKGWISELELKTAYKELLLSEAVRLYRAGTYRKY